MKESPKYLKLYETSNFSSRISRAQSLMHECRLCPRKCRVNRHKNEKGFCTADETIKIYSYGPHFGEEPQISGINGSGTIFFSNCGLRCCFCQNYDISILGQGIAITAGQLSAIMLGLQDRGCHNINLVTPTHYMPQILAALKAAVPKGLQIPLVYNTSGYENPDILKLLDGIVDIYMPDFKFIFPQTSTRYCNAPDYPEVVKTALQEMHRQVGILKTDKKGIAYSGLLIRHLVMPEGLAETKAIVDYISRKLSSETFVNIMSQYHPSGKSDDHAALTQSLSAAEYRAAVRHAKSRLSNLIR